MSSCTPFSIWPCANQQNGDAKHPRLKNLMSEDLNLSNVARFLAFFTLADDKLDTVTFLKAAVSTAGNRRVMDKNVLFHAIDFNEAKALGAVEPFHNTCNCVLRHTVLLFFLLVQAVRIGRIILANKQKRYNFSGKPSYTLNSRVKENNP